MQRDVSLKVSVVIIEESVVSYKTFPGYVLVYIYKLILLK
jgi:hypothetical protein